MKYFLIFHILFFVGFAKTRIKSDIPLPETQVLNTSFTVCDNECLTNFILNEQVFSFLANVPQKDTNSLVLNEQKLILESLLNIERLKLLNEIRIALILPEKVIGRYSELTAKAVFSYLLNRDKKFQVKSYFIGDENNTSIKKALEDIHRDKFQFVIAPMTIKGANIISNLNSNLYIYFPTIFVSEMKNKNMRMFFGGINYKSQIKQLSKYINNRRISLFYDDSKKGKELNSMVLRELHQRRRRPRISFNMAISRENSDFSNLFKDRNDTVGNIYFLNTTKVKSSILLAQLTSFDQEPSLILSTQINYSPVLLSMTQYYDRKKMLIANSISNRNTKIVDTNSLFNNDITYDWINYSTTLGVDFLYHLISGNKRLYKEPLRNNQIIYSTRIMKPLQASFSEIE